MSSAPASIGDQPDGDRLSASPPASPPAPPSAAPSPAHTSEGEAEDQLSKSILSVRFWAF